MTTLLFSKRFEAWVTGLTDSYRYNPYVRTTVNVVVLEAIFALVVVLVASWAVGYAQTNTVGSISRHIAEVVKTGTSTESLPQVVETVRNRTIEYVFAGLVLFTLVFGYLIVYFALRPTRTSLQFQKRFIGNVAHEIRTPLAVIKTNTEVALFDPALSPAVRQTFEDTLGELDRISEIINNLLSFTTLTKPGVMKQEVVSLGAIAHTVLERHRSLAESRGIALAESIRTEGLVLGNATALEQVVTNLVKNAINYTPKDKGGVVEVQVDADREGRITVTVSDTGIGIPQEELFHVFEPFYKGDTSRARGTGGGTSGLGLAIVNEIVRLHRGSINIRSALNRGTSIRLSFPTAEEAVTREPVFSEDEGTNEVNVDFS